MTHTTVTTILAGMQKQHRYYRLLLAACIVASGIAVYVSAHISSVGYVYVGLVITSLIWYMYTVRITRMLAYHQCKLRDMVYELNRQVLLSVTPGSTTTYYVKDTVVREVVDIASYVDSRQSDIFVVKTKTDESYRITPDEVIVNGNTIIDVR